MRMPWHASAVNGRVKVNERNVRDSTFEQHLILKKCAENLCQHVSVSVGQRSSNGQIYAIVCLNLTYLWYRSWTSLILPVIPMLRFLRTQPHSEVLMGLYQQRVLNTAGLEIWWSIYWWYLAMHVETCVRVINIRWSSSVDLTVFTAVNRGQMTVRRVWCWMMWNGLCDDRQLTSV